MCISAFLKRSVLPRINKVLSITEVSSQDPYKRNGVSMIYGAFLRKVLQKHQETTGFIRVWEVEFLMSQNDVFPMVSLAFWRGLGASGRAAGAGTRLGEPGNTEPDFY